MTALAAHACGTHRPYRLTCEQFDAMRAHAGGCCQRCGQGADLLVIDHDHAGGMAAVRGLVCTHCNSHLGRVDGLRAQRDELDDAYLASAWHFRRRIDFVPTTHTRVRTVRVDDALWQAAQERAADRRESVADVIRRALLAYVEQT